MTKFACNKELRRWVELVPGVAIPAYGRPRVEYNPILGDVTDDMIVKRTEVLGALPYCPQAFFSAIIDRMQHEESLRKRTGGDFSEVYKRRKEFVLSLYELFTYKTKRIMECNMSLGDWVMMTEQLCVNWKDLQLNRLAVSAIFGTGLETIDKWFTQWAKICDNRKAWRITNTVPSKNWMEAVLEWKRDNVDAHAQAVSDDAIKRELAIKDNETTTTAIVGVTEDSVAAPVEVQGPVKDVPETTSAVKVGTVVKDWDASDEMIAPKTIHDIEPVVTMQFQYTFNWTFMPDVIKLVDIEYCDMVSNVECREDGCTVMFTLECKNMRPIDPRAPEASFMAQHEILDIMMQKAALYYRMLHKCAEAIASVREEVLRTTIKEDTSAS